jgi:hypothetical protein
MKRVNRFLLRERYNAKDLFLEIRPHIDLIGGIFWLNWTHCPLLRSLMTIPAVPWKLEVRGAKSISTI